MCGRKGYGNVEERLCWSKLLRECGGAKLLALAEGIVQIPPLYIYLAVFHRILTASVHATKVISLSLCNICVRTSRLHSSLCEQRRKWTPITSTLPNTSKMLANWSILPVRPFANLALVVWRAAYTTYSDRVSSVLKHIHFIAKLRSYNKNSTQGCRWGILD